MKQRRSSGTQISELHVQLTAKKLQRGRKTTLVGSARTTVKVNLKAALGKHLTGAAVLQSALALRVVLLFNFTETPFLCPDHPSTLSCHLVCPSSSAPPKWLKTKQNPDPVISMLV